MLLLKFIWSRFILFAFASLVPFYAGFFCTFPSPRQAIYSHQSRPGARPSFAPKTSLLLFCKYIKHMITSFLVQLPFCIEVYYFKRQMSGSPFSRSPTWWYFLSLSLIRESRLSILYIVVALMDNLGSQVKAHLLPEPNHSIIGCELIIVVSLQNTYKCINV